MKKKLTLDETWELCLEMWKWIAGESDRDSTVSVRVLKGKWLAKNGYKDKLSYECFFCDHTVDANDEPHCSCCPGVLVDEMFRCTNKRYHFRNNPTNFLE